MLSIFVSRFYMWVKYSVFSYCLRYADQLSKTYFICFLEFKLLVFEAAWLQQEFSIIVPSRVLLLTYAVSTRHISQF